MPRGGAAWRIPQSLIDRVEVAGLAAVAVDQLLSDCCACAVSSGTARGAQIERPLVTAKAFSTLDVLSNGHAILGVGVCHVEGEFEVLGRSHRRWGWQVAARSSVRLPPR